jgi:DNA repair ATPase RecN
MKQVTAVVLSLVLTAIAFAEPQATGAGKSKTTAKKSTSVATELQQLRQALEAQQQQIQQLSNEVKSRDQALQQLQQRLDQSQAVATQAQSKADTAASQASQQEQTVTALKNDVSDLKATAANVAVNLQETQKSFQGAQESPTALHYKGITITPGGFVVAETVWRKRALGADVNTPLNAIPMPGASASNISEFYGSGRQSRVSMLAEGKVKNFKLTGYFEGDFLSAGVTSNNNQSNSYTFRQRQAWGQVALEDGLTVTGGQMWA